MLRIIISFLFTFYTLAIWCQPDSLYFFDFENIDTVNAQEHFFIRNKTGVFKDAEPFLPLSQTVSYGNGHSQKTSDYRKFDVGRLFLYHSPSWYVTRYNGTSYNHIELELDAALPANKYYDVSFVTGNMRSHRFKPGHYGVRFSDRKIIKEHPGDLLDKPDIFFNFTTDQELEKVHAVYYASKEVKYIYFGLFKEDSTRVPKAFTKLGSKLSYSDTAAHVFITKPTRVIIDNILLKELNKDGSKFTDVYFGTDEDQLTDANYLATIDLIADYLNAHPRKMVLIQGYTDHTGSISYNLDLSKRRAENIKSRMAEYGVDPKRIITLGKGIHATSKDGKMDRKVSFLVFN